MFGAFLHDIGKIEIKKEVLVKPEQLNEEEWEKVKNHTKIGSKILEPLEFNENILPIILYHHENYDGTGYPEGKKGENIPFNARILRIIDSFDAMITERPYSKSLDKEEALKEIREGSGNQYDPDLAEKFITFAENNIEVK